MATLKKVNGGWQAQVARRGVRRAKTFPTKIEAKDWAARQEYLIVNGEGEFGAGTFGDAMDRYAREVSPKKGGARWEIIRLEKLGRDKVAKVAMSEIRAGDFADWRDRRLQEVSAASVRREMGLMSAVMTIARKEWGLIPINPLADVAKPPPAPPRDRRVSDEEIEALAAAARTPQELLVIQAFRLSIETGMRAGEVLRLTPEHISGRVAHLPKTKNGTARDVPLTARAVLILEEVGGAFDVTGRVLDVVFRRVRDRAGIKGLTYHDSRHEATTRLAKKLQPFALARVLGHKDMSQTLAYYNETAEELAGLLD